VKSNKFSLSGEKDQGEQPRKFLLIPIGIVLVHRALVEEQQRASAATSCDDVSANSPGVRESNDVGNFIGRAVRESGRKT